MATPGMSWQQHCYGGSAAGTSKFVPSPAAAQQAGHSMDYSQDLHLKMSKKIAQLTKSPEIQKKADPKRNDTTLPEYVYIWELKAKLLEIVLDLQNIDVQNEARGYLFILMFSYRVSTTSIVLTVLDCTLQSPALSHRNPRELVVELHTVP